MRRRAGAGSERTDPRVVIRRAPRAGSWLGRGPVMNGSGRLLWANALYFRDHRVAIDASDGAHRLLSLAALFDATGDADAACACLESYLTAGAGAPTERDRRRWRCRSTSPR